MTSHQLHVLMQELGAQQVSASTQRSREKGSESRTEYGKTLIKQAIEPVSKAIEEFLETAKTGKPGRKHLSCSYIGDMDPKVVAYVSLSIVIDTITKTSSLNNLAVKIGRSLELEQKFSFYEKTDPDTFKKASKRLATVRHVHRKQTSMTQLMQKKSESNCDWETWSDTVKLQLGVNIVTGKQIGRAHV